MVGADSPERTRVRARVDSANAAWVEHESRAGGAFHTIGHAMEQALGRWEDEFNFVRRRCEAKRLPFVPGAFYAIHDELLEAADPRVGKARKTDTRQRQLLAGFVETRLCKFIEAQAHPNGGFNPDYPVAHAIDSGLALLRQAEVTDPPARTSRFGFDGDALWESYVKARRGWKS